MLSAKIHRRLSKAAGRVATPTLGNAEVRELGCLAVWTLDCFWRDGQSLPSARASLTHTTYGVNNPNKENRPHTVPRNFGCIVLVSAPVCMHIAAAGCIVLRNLTLESAKTA
jgi:hypothetical protein